MERVSEPTQPHVSTEERRRKVEVEEEEESHHRGVVSAGMSLRRTISDGSASGSSVEFFDAVESLDELDGDSSRVPLQTLSETNAATVKHESGPTKETSRKAPAGSVGIYLNSSNGSKDTWTSAREFPEDDIVGDDCSNDLAASSISLIDAAITESAEEEEGTCAVKEVPPLNISSLAEQQQGVDEEDTVPHHELRKQCDEEDEEALKRLTVRQEDLDHQEEVDNCASAVITNLEGCAVDPKPGETTEKECSSSLLGEKANETITSKDSTQNVEIGDSYLTPNRIDCNVCDFTSPLESLYLFCLRGDNKEQMPNDCSLDEMRSNSIKTRTSISDENDLPPASGVADESIPLANLSGDSSDGDSEATDRADRFQIKNNDTGDAFDMRTVFTEDGLSNSIETDYSFLPSRAHLTLQRQSSSKWENECDDATGPSASIDNSDMTSLGRGINFSAKTNRLASKVAANMRKGISELRSSQKQKLPRMRASTADEVPSNAIYVKSRARAPEQCHDMLADSSFNPMLLVSTRESSSHGPGWCASFSQDGRFLATAGESGCLEIWAVAPSSRVLHPNGVVTLPAQEETICTHFSFGDVKLASDSNDSDGSRLRFIGTGPELATNLEILSKEPIQRYTDHDADVIDLSWSHTNFLLTASLDKSVRLYHHTKSECLHLFKHANLVASVDFHPSDDRYFISGGVDKKLRLWDVTSGRVKEWAQSPSVITTVRFSPDGKYACAGLFRGQVYWYSVDDGLKYYTQIACRNRSGKHRQGKKVTGISFVRAERDDWLSTSANPPMTTPDCEDSEIGHSIAKKLSHSGREVAARLSTLRGNGAKAPDALRYTERMLVSTNDSRLRLYNLNDFCLIRKYKGNSNLSMQIRARVSESGSHIACGSETGQVFIWETSDKSRRRVGNHMMDKAREKAMSHASFEASKSDLPIVTDTVFFPGKSLREALASSDVFPFALGMDRVDDDLSNAAILTLDYDGRMRVFLRKSCLDNILDSCTPRGGMIT